MDAADRMLLDSAVRSAKRDEQETGKPHYVVVNASPNRTQVYVTTRMPLLGAWYDSDGIRHG